MMRTLLKICLVLPLIVLAGCKDNYRQVSPDQKVAILPGPLTIITKTPTETTFSWRYYVTGKNLNGGMISQNFWGFDTLNMEVEIDSVTNAQLQGHEISRVHIPAGADEPYSLLVLMDKSLVENDKKENGGYITEVKKFERSLVLYYSSVAGYEIAIGGFGKDNNFTKGLKIMEEGFKGNIKDLDLQKMAPFFDADNDEGSYNLKEALDSTISWMAAKGHYNNKVILVVTKRGDELTRAEIKSVTDRANSYGVKICTYDHGFPGHTEYSLASKTGGVCISKYASSPNLDDPIDLLLPALHQQLTGGEWYESTFKLTTDKPTFNKYYWLELDYPIYYYNAKANETRIYYE